MTPGVEGDARHCLQRSPRRQRHTQLWFRCPAMMSETLAPSFLSFRPNLQICERAGRSWWQESSVSVMSTRAHRMNPTDHHYHLGSNQVSGFTCQCISPYIFHIAYPENLHPSQPRAFIRTRRLDERIVDLAYQFTPVALIGTGGSARL